MRGDEERIREAGCEAYLIEADPRVPVHRNHPPLSRSRPEHSGQLAAKR
jgi:hypothetical protein